MTKPLLIFVLGISIGCTSNTSKTGEGTKDSVVTVISPIKPLHILTEEEEEGEGADLRLSITGFFKKDSISHYLISSTYNGKELGFEIAAPTNMSMKGTLDFKSTGQNSDEFLHVLSGLYESKSDSLKKFTESYKVTYIDLNEFAKAKLGAEISDTTGVKELKLFFETGDENNYAELYLNINEKSYWVEVVEKDAEYREAILRFLSRQ
jgi:hypothetical protein